jgi:uncharacterized protein (DUF58 family)
MPAHARNAPAFPIAPAHAPAVVARRYHFHVPGVIYAIVTVVLFLGAVNGQNNLLFCVFGLAAAGLLISGGISGVMLTRLSIERQAPAVVQAGAPFTVRYVIRSRSRLWPAFALCIEELPADPDDTRLSSLRAFAPHVPAGSRVEIDAAGTASGRGMASLLRVRVWTTFPFGLMKKSVTFRQPDAVLIRPHPADVPDSMLRSAAGGLEPSESNRPLRTGDEFHSLRDYVPGDSLRRIAWRATARRGALVTREHSGARPPRLWIVPDAPGPGAAADAVARAAAGVASAALRAGFAVAIAAGERTIPLGAGAAHLGPILDALALWMPGPTPVPAASARDRVVVVRPGAHAGATPPGATILSIEQLGVTPALPPARRRRRLWPRRRQASPA